MLNPCTTYTLQNLANPKIPQQHHRYLLKNGKQLPFIVFGDAIDLQLTNKRHTLIASSYDYFDGCCHWFYLLDQHDQIIDQIAMPDTFGFIQNVVVISNNEISFGYFQSEQVWKLSIASTSFWSFSLQNMARRLNRFIFSKRYLQLSLSKQ